MSAVVAQQERRTTDSRVVLAIVAVAVVLSSLDLFIVNVALPRIAVDFSGSQISGLSWVLNAYAIVYAALLVPAGRLGDRNGNKRTFLLGLGVFVFGSALCALAWDTGALVAFRILQAAGAALLTPSSLGLLLAATPAERRATAVRLWVAFGGLGAALGPVIGGLLVELDWRWVFLVNVPLGVIALVIGWRLLPSPAGSGGTLPDGFGALMLIASVASLILSVVKGEDWGWGSAGVIGGFVATAAFGAAFVWSSRRHHSPVVDPGLLRVPNFVLMLGNSALFNIAFAGMLLSAVLWMQNVWGWSALKTGLAIAPGPHGGATGRDLGRAAHRALGCGAGAGARRDVVRGRNRLVGTGNHAASRLCERSPGRHDPERYRSRADHADQRGGGHRGAATAAVRDRFGGAHHGPPDRNGCRRGDSGCGAGYTGRTAGDADRVPPRLVCDRGRVGRGRTAGTGRATAETRGDIAVFSGADTADFSGMDSGLVRMSGSVAVRTVDS